MPLRDQVVDVFLTGPDQLPSDRQGGLGRMTDARNATYEHFDEATPSKPEFLNLRQRKGFTTVPLTGHSVDTGAAESITWNGARLLHSIDDSLISIVRSKPRVLDGTDAGSATDWTSYGKDRVLTNKTTARPWYTGQSVAQAPDASWLSSVSCVAWTELTQASNISDAMVTFAVVGFRSDNGAWVRKPFVAKESGGAGNMLMCRVVNDGVRFWVFIAYHNGGNPKIDAFVYDTNGQQLATNTTDMSWDVFDPGYWDVQRRPSTAAIVLVQPNGTNPAADNNVIFQTMTYAASVITTVSHVDATIHCGGPVQWLTNFNDTKQYLVTTNGNVTPRLWGYQVDGLANAYAQTHEFNFNTTFPALPDTLIGFVGPTLGSSPDLTVSYGVPAIDNSYGSASDPQLRYIKSYTCTFADAVTFIRQTNSVCHVSRAFVIDDDYYAWTYYQSGGGSQAVTSTEVTLTSGDYFYGAAEQPLTISLNDGTIGSDQSFINPSGTQIYVTSALGSFNISSAGTPDKVEYDSTITVPGYAAGTTFLKWTFQNMAASVFMIGGNLKVQSSSISDANHEWRVVQSNAGPSTVVWTLFYNTAGGTIASPGNFTTVGTGQIISYTYYHVPDIGTKYDGNTQTFLENGTAVVTGNAVSANNGSKTIIFTSVTPASSSLAGSPLFGTYFAVVTGSEVTNSTGYTVSLQPNQANNWGFSAEIFDDSYEDEILVIANDNKPENNGEHVITDVTPTHTITAGADTTVTAEYFPPVAATGMTAQINLAAGQKPYTFHIQSVTFDYSYLNATISISNTTHASTAGLYKVIQVIDDHTVVTVPVSVTGIPKNEALEPDSQSVVILLNPSIGIQIQPQYFLTPISDVTTPQVGAIELGLAYADWRREGLATDIGAANPYLLHVSSPCLDNTGTRLFLPFRAVTVTEQSATVIGGNVSQFAIDAAVIGIKQINVDNVYGTVCNDIIPGPMASSYEGGSFVEKDILLGLEQPSLRSEQAATNPQALTKDVTYSYVWCLEALDKRTGARIWTAPTPALSVTLTGDNNSITLQGRLPIPLGTDGTPQNFARHYGLSNRVNLVLSGYRTAIQNGLPTTDHYKITEDLIPNGTAPISDVNDSGFAFPDEFTWTYKDENLDSVILSNEKLYTDRGLLPRFKPPAFHSGAEGWQDRDWLLGYDGAVWISGAMVEGEEEWFTPLFRIPTPFEPAALGNLETFLAGFATDSKWYLPSFTPPASNGAVSNIPSWRRLPLEGGCTGIVKQIRNGVAYASNFGGVWFLSRDLRDEWLSEDYVDSFTGKTVSAMDVDEKQRLYVATNSTDLFVYDQIAKRWSRWIVYDATNPKLLAVNQGTMHYQSQACVAYYDTASAIDSTPTGISGCPLGFTLSSLQFGNVTGVKAVRQFQLRGKYKGSHRLVTVITYPDQNPTHGTTTATITPDPAKPYVIDVYPLTEEASSYALAVDAVFLLPEAAGDSFELDVIGALVGIDGRAGINRSTQEAG